MHKFYVSIVFSLSVIVCAQAQSPPAELLPSSPLIAELVASGDYNEQLCVTAQMIVTNSDGDDFDIVIERARGKRFNMEQMDTEPATHTVTVATLVQTIEVDGEELDAAVACKMVNRDRVNDLFGLELSGPARNCRDVNEFTYRVALDSLSDEQRSAYESGGRSLYFADDYVTGAGAEWLPSVINDFIHPADLDGSAGQLSVQSPSVQVPWDYEERDWFQGTQHCKLVTLDAMRRWMTTAALWSGDELFPRVTPVCNEPSSRSSTAGSCILYFGPAGATFCQDFSGSAWTQETARADCAQRYATAAEWNTSEGSYTGSGGIYNPLSCKERDALAELARDPFGLPESTNNGACVWRCNDPDEALWHVMSSIERTGGRSLRDNCELFLEPYW